MPHDRTQRLASAVSIAACVALALLVARPMYYYCEAVAGRDVCQWALDRGTATDDGRYFVMVWEAARVALKDFRQWPSWNPYHCGGAVLYQDPQAPFPGPLFLLTFWWLPAVAAIKLWQILHMIAAALGARRLAEDVGANAPEQLFGAAVVTAGGSMAWHIGGGNLSFTAFLLFPWVLWSHRRALRDARWAVLTAALLALAAVEGGVYPVPLMLAALGLDALARMGDRGDRGALFVSLPVVGLLMPLLGAVRLVPILKYLAQHPRLMPLDDQMTVAEVFQTWLARDHERAFPPHAFVWDEYGDYLGLLPVLVLLAGVAVAVWRRDEHTRARRIDLFVLATLVWITLGNIPAFSLYGLMHELPIYRSLRVPSRYLYAVNLLVAATCVWALMAARRSAEQAGARRSLLRALVALELAAVVFVAVDMSVTNWPHIQRGIDPALPRGRAGQNFYQDSQTAYWLLPTHAVRGVGTTGCYVPFEWGPAPGLWDGPGAQARLDPPDAGRADSMRWSPNEVTVTVALDRPARLLVNQNYESGWSSSYGAAAAHEGVLSVALPSGRRTITFRHRPPGLKAGFALSALGVVLSALIALGATPTRLSAARAWLARRLKGVASQG